MIIETDQKMDDRSVSQGMLYNSIKESVSKLMCTIFTKEDILPSRTDPNDIPEKIFDILSGREFCYLSKSQVAPYKKKIVAQIHDAVRVGEPIHFYFDIGGGYHASTQPMEKGLCFDVGIAELFILSQISIFCGKIEKHYPGGAVFSLVIDNMCSNLINDIPLEKTKDYCGSLRNLILDTGMERRVGVIVESEHFSIEEYNFSERLPDTGTDHIQLTRKEHENVSRFMGRPCDSSEAVERFHRYKILIDISERLLAGLIRGVHMTQRASESTICFRPFPGADSRVQCGEVAIGRNNKNRLRPFLLTSRNIMDYACTRFQFPDLLPKEISHVTYAEHIEANRDSDQPV